MAFYEFNQNNSGGSFDVDDKVCHRVFIEAESDDEANNKAEKLGIYFNGCDSGMDCRCCGDRWTPAYQPIDMNELKYEGYRVGVYDHYKNPERVWEEKYGRYTIIKPPKWETRYQMREYVGTIGFKDIEEYVQYLANEYGSTVPEARIFYKSGTVKEIFIQKEK